MKQNKISEWGRLDNAAKIFPPTSNHQDTKVFRCCCRLKYDINRDDLQKALNIAIKNYPVYKSVIRKGLFWYYFEQSSITPIVKKETKSPCSVLYRENEKNLLFEVTYYKNRVNLEVYHALADGVGAVNFLKHIIEIYIRITKLNSHKVIEIQEAHDKKFETIDCFEQNYSNTKGRKNPSLGRAYKIKGKYIEGQVLKVINGTTDTKGILEIAHKYNTTITVYLTSLLIYSIAKAMSDKTKNRLIVISIPVNLRPYFKSISMRNFFSVIHVPYLNNKKGMDLNDTDLIEIIEYVKEFFKKELTTENFQLRLNRLVAIEHNYLSRVIPLVLKKPILKIAHTMINKEVTSSLSNVGQIEVNKEIEEYIEGFDMYVSTREVQIGICSFKDEMSISFTTPFVESRVEKYFFRELSKNGLDIKIATQKNN